MTGLLRVPAVSVGVAFGVDMREVLGLAA